MLIDWFTVLAQALNFLILVALLKYFLYQPILDAIDQREKRIEAELKDAAAQKAEAQTEKDSFSNKNAVFDHERSEQLNQMKTEVQTEKDRLLEEARQEASELIAQHQATLKSEQTKLQLSLKHKTEQEVFAIASKTLKDLASSNLEAQILEVFVRRMQALTAAEKADLVTALKTEKEPLCLKSGFMLSEAQKSKLLATIQHILGPETTVKYEISAKLICGIELSSHGQKMAWSIADYLGSLEASLEQLFQAHENPLAKSRPKTKPADKPAPAETAHEA
jgi:F-type H+-transporting ATPase subunit b